MNIQITVRGLDEKEATKSHSVKQYIEDKFEKLAELLEKEQQPVNVDMVATIVHPHPNHEFEMNIRGPRYHVIVKRSGPELYKIIDEVMDIGFHDVVKHKEKMVDNRRRNGAQLKEKDRFLKS